MTLLILPKIATSERDCSKSEYDRCVRIADPLVKVLISFLLLFYRFFKFIFVFA